MNALSSPALSVDAVTHRYAGAKRADSGVVALDGVSFEVAPGERFGLLGPNGGGKTTLFRLISTLMRPTAGRVAVFGDDAQASPAAVRARLGVIFQQPALDGALTVCENLRFHGALVGVRGAALEQRIDEVLAAFSITDRQGDAVKTLSGGLQRRTDLARGLLHRPALLLLDEPTTGLDPIARRELWDALDRLQRTEHTTVVVATHLMEEAARCGRVGILDHGRLVALGPPDRLTAELGGETLWLDSDDAGTLASDLQAQFGLASRRVGKSVLVEHDDPAALLPRVYAAFGSRLTAATVRRPTLEDVFVAVTSRAGASVSPVASVAEAA